MTGRAAPGKTSSCTGLGRTVGAPDWKTSIAVESADTAWLPSVSVQLDDDEAARKVLRLVDALEDCDDVQNVWANFDISDEILEAVG